MSLNRVFTDGVTVYDAAFANGLQAAWDTYTPAVSGFSVGNGTLSGRFLQIGKTIVVRIAFSAGSGSSYSGTISIGLPVAANTNGEQWLPVKLRNGSGDNFAGLALLGSAALNVYVPSSTTNTGLIPSGTSQNPGTTGNLVVEGVYEAA